MNQSKFSVEMDSLIVCENETIRFIVREDEGGESEDYKKYLIRWTPFQKD